MTKTNLEAARAALRELDEAYIAEMLADVKALAKKGAAYTPETPLGVEAVQSIKAHTQGLISQFEKTPAE